MQDELAHALSRISEGRLAADLESETLDFKEDERSPRETMKLMAEAAACFANADGGVVVLGVRDQAAGAAALVGTEFDAHSIKQGIHANTEPSLLVDVLTFSCQGVELVAVTVPAGVELHADTSGRIKHRVGTSCLAMTPRMQDLRRLERSTLDYSSETADLTVADIDPAAMEAARHRLRSTRDELFPLADSSDFELLRHLGVVDGEDRLLQAGEVLFCDRDDDRPWVLYQHSALPGGEASAVERLCGPLITVLDRLVDLVWARRHTTPLTLADASQIEIADFPRDAVREAVANALLHRELRIDRPVSVHHSPESFVVESPGRLVPGITEHNILTHPSRPRNPCLFRAARRLRIAEDTGRGIDRIYRELLRSGHDAPAITQSEDTTRVAFVGGAPQARMARFVAQLDPVLQDDVDTLLVIFTLLASRTVTEADLAPIIQKQPVEAGAVLSRLATDEVGIVEPTLESRTRRNPTYRLRASALRALGSAVRYQKRSTEDVDAKIVSHLRDYGRINNRTLRDLFDVDVHRASAMLRDLRRRGLVVKATDQQRGPSVVYAPGPQFPRR